MTGIDPVSGASSGCTLEGMREIYFREGGTRNFKKWLGVCIMGNYEEREIILRRFVREHTKSEDEMVIYFTKKINKRMGSLPPSPSRDHYVDLAHKVYDAFRKKLVDIACEQAEANPISWNFTEEGWSTDKEAFRDWVWQESQSLCSYGAAPAVNKVMKMIFTSLPSNFSPKLRNLRSSDDEQDYYPGS